MGKMYTLKGKLRDIEFAKYKEQEKFCDAFVIPDCDKLDSTFNASNNPCMVMLQVGFEFHFSCIMDGMKSTVWLITRPGLLLETLTRNHRRENRRQNYLCIQPQQSLNGERETFLKILSL